MSVDYSSVLIYGYKISAENVKRIQENIGVDAWIDACEHYDGYEDYILIRDNDYYGESDYYFGVTIGSELHLDAIDAICWKEFESDQMAELFEATFGSMEYADNDVPMMYHFVRVY